MAKHKSKPKPERQYDIVKVSARPPGWPGDMHVLVTCSCGRNTDFHYPSPIILRSILCSPAKGA
jgi:hypothetical protein